MCKLYARKQSICAKKVVSENKKKVTNHYFLLNNQAENISCIAKSLINFKVAEELILDEL